MFSNLTKNQQVFIIDKREDGDLKIGVVDEIKAINPYQINTVGITPTLPFDIVVKYENGQKPSRNYHLRRACRPTIMVMS